MALTTTGAVYGGYPTSLQTILPSYAYQQYADDDDIQAFVMSYNAQAQQFLNWFNALNLPIYTGGVVSGLLLDWVANGIYGQYRPVFQAGTNRVIGAINTFPINGNAINRRKETFSGTYTLASDDIFRRCMTWNLYKGDGYVFNIRWLKRRIFRFINGMNGISPVIDNTYTVSVSFSGTTFEILLPVSSVSAVLQTAIQQQVVYLPFEYNFNVTVA